MFRRIERLAAEQMPEGYVFTADPGAVAQAVLSKGSWAVLALTLHIELFTQAHYRESIEPDDNLSPLFKDVFLFHWKEESQHAILDELEWRRLHADLTEAERDRGVDEFIELVAAVDSLLQAQAAEDAGYFAETCGRAVGRLEREELATGVLEAYRRQYILSGARHPHFVEVLTDLTTEPQRLRIEAALTTLS